MLAACSQGATEAPAADPDDDNLIECAVAGAAAFARECLVVSRPNYVQPKYHTARRGAAL